MTGLRGWLTSFAWLLAGLGLAQAAAPVSPARPNIVLLVADDWGFSDVGSFGGEIATPNLDALAAQGVRFSNFHVSASCAPTRSMLMTGVDNHRNGIGNMPETIPQAHEGKPGYLGVLDTNVVTVATLLQDAGYRTSMSGKWHLGHEPHNLPPARGFERSIIQADSGSDNWEMRPYLVLKPKVAWYEDGQPMTSLPADYYSSTYFVNNAIKFIESNRSGDKPFFSYIAFQANHIPIQAPREFIDKYKGKYKEGWTALREQRRARAVSLGLIPKDAPMVTMATTADWNALTPEQRAYQERRMEAYAGMAEAMDHEVGRLIAYLKASKQYDNTVFVFLSDNGAEASDPYETLSGRAWLDWQYDRSLERLGSKGAYSIIGPSWASAAASPLSTYKFYSGEGGIRVPMILAGAPALAGASGQRVNGSFAHVTDIAPTLLELAGLPRQQADYHGRPIEPMIGASLLPVVRGQGERVHPADQMIGYELSGNRAVFKGDYKLIRNIRPVGDDEWHLYDLAKDPGEVHDLKDQQPELYRELLAGYERWAKDNGVLPMPADYDPIGQVQINAFVNVILRPLLLGLLLLIGLSVFAWRRFRR